MAKKFSLDFKGMDEMIKRIEMLADHDTVKRIAEKAMQASFDYVTQRLEDAIENSNFNFDRTGETEKSLIREPDVVWVGDEAKMSVGFDISGSITGHTGFASIFLMYGTPTFDPDEGLYNAVYGSDVKRQVKKIQQTIFEEEIEKIMDGG